MKSKLGRGRLHLYVNPATTLENKALVLNSYYRRCAKRESAELLPVWEEWIGVKAVDWGSKDENQVGQLQYSGKAHLAKFRAC